MEQIPLTHFLVLSTMLFFLGVYGFFTRRNMITMLMSTELILNSVNINFIAFNKYLYPHQLEGIFFTLRQPRLRWPSPSSSTSTASSIRLIWTKQIT